MQKHTDASNQKNITAEDLDAQAPGGPEIGSFEEARITGFIDKEVLDALEELGSI